MGEREDKSMDNEVKWWCKHCDTELPPSHTGPCPKCGESGILTKKGVGGGTVGLTGSLSGIHKPKWSSESLALLTVFEAIFILIANNGINLLPFRPGINYAILIGFLLIVGVIFWWQRYYIITKLIRLIESKFGGERKF